MFLELMDKTSAEGDGFIVFFRSVIIIWQSKDQFKIVIQLMWLLFAFLFEVFWPRKEPYLKQVIGENERLLDVFTANAI